MFCPQCGKEAGPNARFCAKCGKSLNQSTDPAPSVSVRSKETGSSRRPVWVWVISVFYVFSIGFTLLSFALVFSGAIGLNAAQQKYFASLGILDYLSSVGVGLVTMWAALLLFRLRKGAVPAFGLALTLNIGLTIVHTLTKNWPQALGSSGLVGALFGLVVLGAVFLYARKLRNKGVLVP